ncbi:hypothetical protein HDU76_002649, partial [Blyttiomyces sp. JEL0837]
ATESENAITGHIESPSRSASEFNEDLRLLGYLDLSGSNRTSASSSQQQHQQQQLQYETQYQSVSPTREPPMSPYNKSHQYTSSARKPRSAISSRKAMHLGLNQSPTQSSSGYFQSSNLSYNPSPRNHFDASEYATRLEKINDDLSSQLMTETQLRQTERVARNKLQEAHDHALEEISHLVARCGSLEEEIVGLRRALNLANAGGGGGNGSGGGNGVGGRHGKSGRGSPRGVNVDVIGGDEDGDEGGDEDENGTGSLNETEQRLRNLELDHGKVVEERRDLEKQVKLLTHILQAANEECHSLRDQVKEKELLHLEVRRLECQLVNLQEELEDERTKVALLESGGGGVGAGGGFGGVGGGGRMSSLFAAMAGNDGFGRKVKQHPFPNDEDESGMNDNEAERGMLSGGGGGVDGNCINAFFEEAERGSSNSSTPSKSSRFWHRPSEFSTPQSGNQTPQTKSRYHSPLVVSTRDFSRSPSDTDRDDSNNEADVQRDLSLALSPTKAKKSPAGGGGGLKQLIRNATAVATVRRAELGNGNDNRFGRIRKTRSASVIRNFGYGAPKVDMGSVHSGVNATSSPFLAVASARFGVGLENFGTLRSQQDGYQRHQERRRQGKSQDQRQYSLDRKDHRGIKNDNSLSHGDPGVVETMQESSPDDSLVDEDEDSEVDLEHDASSHYLTPTLSLSSLHSAFGNLENRLDGDLFTLASSSIDGQDNHSQQRMTRHSCEFEGEDDGMVPSERAMVRNQTEGGGSGIVLNRIHPSSSGELLIKLLFDSWIGFIYGLMAKDKRRGNERESRM